MAQEDGRVSSYREYAEHILPRVKKAGYNLKLGTASINAFKLNLKDDTKRIFVTPKKKRWISEINKLLPQ